jgi:AraC family ethanolamine operon transcriptional activator
MGESPSVTSRFPAGVSFDHSVESLEEMEVNAAFWNLRTVQLDPGCYPGRIAAVHTGRMQLARSWRGRASRLEGAVPPGTLVLAVPLSDDAPIQYRGRKLTSRAVILQEHDIGIDFSFQGKLDIVTVAVDQSELLRRARALWNEDLECRKSFGVLDFPSKYIRAKIAEQLAGLLVAAQQRPSAISSSEVARGLENAVLDLILCAVEVRTRPQGRNGRQRAARVAEEYLRAHCRQQVSISDLCEVAGTSRRSLHLGFAELYGMPPLRYLQALRLSGVRRELTTERQHGQRLTEIATRWGFDHLGRFAACYREFFGEQPSKTR